jgi:hypothetical protein
VASLRCAAVPAHREGHQRQWLHTRTYERPPGDTSARWRISAKAQASGSPEAARTFAFRSKPYGQADPFDLFTEVRKYQVRGVAGQITTPMLILDPDNEQFFPGQPGELYDLLPGQKETIEFTQGKGANFHCQAGQVLCRALSWQSPR